MYLFTYIYNNTYFDREKEAKWEGKHIKIYSTTLTHLFYVTVSYFFNKCKVGVTRTFICDHTLNYDTRLHWLMDTLL